MEQLDSTIRPLIMQFLRESKDAWHTYKTSLNHENSSDDYNLVQHLAYYIWQLTKNDDALHNWVLAEKILVEVSDSESNGSEHNQSDMESDKSDSSDESDKTDTYPTSQTTTSLWYQTNLLKSNQWVQSCR